MSYWEIYKFLKQQKQPMEVFCKKGVHKNFAIFTWKLNYSFNKEYWVTEQIKKKGYFRSKAEKINITTEFFIFVLVLVPIFIQTDHFDFLNQICPKRVAQKGYFYSKTERMDTTIEFCIFELVFVSKYTLNKQFWIFGQNFPRKGFSGLKQKMWKLPLNSTYSN